MDQIQFLKKMSGEKRLAQAFLLSDFIRDLARQNIKSQIGSKATKKQILTCLKKRLWQI